MISARRRVPWSRRAFPFESRASLVVGSAITRGEGALVAGRVHAVNAGGADALLLDAVTAWDGMPRLRSAHVHEAAILAVVADALHEEFTWGLGLEAVLFHEGLLSVVLGLLALEPCLLGWGWAWVRLPLRRAGAILEETLAAVH